MDTLYAVQKVAARETEGRGVCRQHRPVLPQSDEQRAVGPECRPRRQKCGFCSGRSGAREERNAVEKKRFSLLRPNFGQPPRQPAKMNRRDREKRTPKGWLAGPCLVGKSGDNVFLCAIRSFRLGGRGMPHAPAEHRTRLLRIAPCFTPLNFNCEFLPEVSYVL